MLKTHVQGLELLSLVLAAQRQRFGSASNIPIIEGHYSRF